MNTINRKLAFVFTGILLFTSTALPAFAADTKNPSDVENLKAVGGNASVSLTWDAATDDTGVKGYQVHYGLKSVSQAGEEYDKKVDVGNVTKYTVSGLTNDKKYYFSVIAYDAAGNESARWAKEATATPTKNAAASDKEAPKVSKAEALNKEQVKVVFSEAVVLPSEDAEDSFSIENDENFEPLPVLKAEMDEEDVTEKTVILTTQVQEKAVSYKLTVGIDIKDKAGNTIISGTSDTAMFTGSDKEKPVEDATAPEVVKVESVDNTHVLVTFNEAIILSIDPADNFKITEETDKTKELTVLGVELEENMEGLEDSVALITTSPQSETSYVVTVLGLKDEDGNEISEIKGTGKFTGKVKIEGDTKDIIPPKDVAEFMAKSLLEAGKYTVTLNWKIPAENVGDVVEQLIYMSIDKGEKYSKKATLDPEATKYDVKDLEPGEYWFKITQKDAAGNESEGVITKLVLAETGPELIGLVALSLGLGRWAVRRKKL